MSRPATNSRQLPHSSELERSLLGGLLQDPSQLPDVAALLTAADFHRPCSRKGASEMCSLPGKTPHIARVAMRPGSPSHGYPMTFLRSSCCPALPTIQARLRVQVPDAR